MEGTLIYKITKKSIFCTAIKTGKKNLIKGFPAENRKNTVWEKTRILRMTKREKQYKNVVKRKEM